MFVERTRTGDILATQQQWVAWFWEHDGEFRDKMSAAGARRKAANRRLTPAPDAPLPVDRLAVNRPKVKVHKLAPWQQMCWGRTGWFCLQTDQRSIIMFCVPQLADLLRRPQLQADGQRVLLSCWRMFGHR